MSRGSELFRAAVTRLLTVPAARGRARQDGAITLLTVDFHLTEDVLRLVKSVRRHLPVDLPVVVVQNGDRRSNSRLRDQGISVVGWGRNIGHGLALDWGLRRVRTEYVLICDPDAVVISGAFRDELMSRLERHSVCGIVISDEAEHQRYHPICLAFKTSLWKAGTWSMQEDWEAGYDVGGALTRELGGLEPKAILRASRGGWNGVVWAECFSNTYGMSRIQSMSDDEVIDGNPVGQVRQYHDRWSRWADLVATGQATVADFPDPEQNAADYRQSGGS